MFALPAPLARLADRTPLRIVGVDPVGADWRIRRQDRALMFTGIVQAVGRIATAKAAADGLRLSLDTDTLDAVGPARRRQRRGQRLLPDDRRHRRGNARASTCRPRRCAARRGSIARVAVNLEKALQLSDRLGGHLVAGHVDGVGVVTRFERSDKRRRQCRARDRGAGGARALYREQGLDRRRRRQSHRQRRRGTALCSQSDPAYTGRDDAGRPRRRRAGQSGSRHGRALRRAAA